MTDQSDARLSSPAVFRNRVPILDVLRTVLAAKNVVPEIASGGGQHIAYFAERLPKLTWQPSDPSPSDAHRSTLAPTPPVSTTSGRQSTSTPASRRGRSTAPTRSSPSTWCTSARGRRPGD